MILKNILNFLIKCCYKSITKSKNLIATRITYIRFWLNGIKCGSDLNVVNASLNIWRQYKGSGTVSVGDRVTFWSYGDHSWNSRCKIMIEKNGSLVIGDDSGFNGVMIYCQEKITIGKYVKVGGGSRIFDTDHHPVNWELRRDHNNGQFAKHSPIVIMDDVFIGAGCYIMKGVTIGARSVVAAGSVVSKNIPPDEVWGGNPAKFIKKL